MSDDGFDISELTNFEKDLMKFANDTLPKESKKFLRETGTKLKKATLSKAKSKVKKDSGDYFKSVKRGKVYKYNGNELAIRCYSGDPVSHLLEKGHRLVKNGVEVGFVDGYHVFEETEKEFANTYYAEAQKFVNQVIDKINE